jgi:isoaspartyl peptidase/L-asparaginase-like protein (Ntn-hydrolase superfamily)
VRTVTDWANRLAALKTRYPKVREPILVALNILLENPNVSLDDAKQVAAEHGARITAASVSAAQRLLSRQNMVPAADATPASTSTTRKPMPPRPARRVRAGDVSGIDAEVLIR